MIGTAPNTIAVAFLKEAKRVLRSGGIIRLVVPDLRKLVDKYVESEDADTFLEDAYLAPPKARTLLGRLRSFLIGERHHHWMYDGPSLCRLLEANGFAHASVLPPGETRIPAPGPLDLRERASESVFVEAEKQASPA